MSSPGDRQAHWPGWRRVRVPLWAAALLGLGAVTLSAGWSGPAAALMLIGAAVGPLLIFAAGTALRVPAPLTALVVLGSAATAAYVVVLAPYRGGVAAAVRDAVPRLLAARPPAPATPALLLPGLAVALLVGVWVAVRTVGDTESGLGQGLLAAPVASLILYVAGMVLTAGAADRTGVLAATLVVVTAVGWFGLDLPGQSTRRVRLPVRARQVAGHGVTVLAMGATVAVLVAVVDPTGAFEPRQLLVPPHRTVQAPNPLPQLATWHADPTAELFRFAPTGGAVPTHLRLVTMQHYTGVSWSASATYYPVDVYFPATLPPGAVRATASGAFTVAGLDGIWIPGLGQQPRVTVSGVDGTPPVEYEADGGSLAALDTDLRSGLSYHVSAEVDAPRAYQLVDAGTPSSSDAPFLVDLPLPPQALLDFAAQVTAAARTPFEQAVAIEAAVQRGRRYNPLAPVGSSYARLQTFLTEPDGGPDGASSEQFAAAFAVLARAVGLPSRVVLGFTPAPDGMVRGRDALAWPEVYFAGYGWYAFAPTPGTGDPDEEKVKQAVLARIEARGGPLATALPTPPATATPTVTPTPASPEASPTATAAPSPTGTASPPPAGSAPSPPPATTSMPPIVAAVGVVLLIVGLLAAARAARRARHRRAGALGAWSEVLDLLVLMGRPAPPSRSATAVAHDLARAVPIPSPEPAAPGHPHPALVIASAAEQASFAPWSGHRSAADLDAWSALRPLRRAARASIPVHRRLFWAIDPRPLVRRRAR